MEKPYISSWLFHYAYTSAIAYGVDADALERTFDFPIDALLEADNQFSPDAYVRLFEDAARIAGDEYLWFKPVEISNVARNNANWYYGFNAGTLRESVARCEESFKLITNAFHLEGVFEGDDYVCRYKTLFPEVRFSKYQSDWNLFQWASIFRVFAGPALELKKIRTVVTDPERLRRYEEYFQIPIQGGGEFDDLIYDKSSADLSNAANVPDPNLDVFLKKLLEGALDSQDVTSPFERKLMGLFQTELQNGTPPLKQIASKMGMSDRTLQRRLAKQGYTFSQAVFLYRHRLAAEYLKQAQLNVSEVARMVGYASLGSFTKGFQKQHGLPPSAYRKKFMK